MNVPGAIRVQPPTVRGTRYVRADLCAVCGRALDMVWIDSPNGDTCSLACATAPAGATERMRDGTAAD